MTGDMFDHAGHTRDLQTGQTGPPQCSHDLRRAGKCAISDDVVSAGLGHVEHRRAGDIDPHCRQLQSQCFVIALHPRDRAIEVCRGRRIG